MWSIPYNLLEKEVDELMKVYSEHGKIIVGVDFDDTIFAYSSKNVKLVEKVRKLLQELRSHITLCLYTIADEKELKYKTALMEEWSIRPDFINESPVDFGYECSKPYFNILLDDKAGLDYTYNILNEFKILLTEKICF